MKSPNQEHAYLSFTIGGSLSVLSFEEAHKGNRVSPPGNRGGGPRGRITELSEASRRNFLRLVASIDQDAFDGKIYYLTLTYPDTWPKDPKVCKRHLENLRKRLTRKFGTFAGFWRLGIQERGAWHFHLLLFASPSFGPLKELRQFVASSWYEVCGRISEGHLQAGTNVEEIRSRKRAGYVGRYLAKKEVFPEELETGKVWGIWNKKLLPLRWETTKVTLEEAYRIRRVYRRLQRKKGTGTLREVQIFVPHENVVRLLEFLKDDKEHPKGARRPLPTREPEPQRASVSRKKEEN